MFPSLSESYFAAVAEASPDVMRILELDGTVEFMNAHGRALLEIDRFEANHRRPWPELWPQETMPQLLAALEAAKRGEIARFRGRCPTAKGKPRWWDSVVSPIRDERGRIIRLLASSRDVTTEMQRREYLRDAVVRLRRAKAEKAASIDKLHAAIDALPAGIAFFDSDDRLTLWNAAYKALGSGEGGVGIRQAWNDPPGPSLSEGMTPEDSSGQGRLGADSAARLLGKPGERRAKDGRWLRFEERPLPDGGRVSAAVDITELKTREEELILQAAALSRAKGEAEAASEAKSAFLANMSHEIRTPLNGVLAMADMLCRSDLAPAERQMAGMIRDSAQMLDHLLSDILDLARTESGDSVIEQAPFHLGEAARSVFELARGKASEKGLALTLAIEPGLDRQMVGDAARLKQVLNKLLTNAVKFTRAGSVEFRVTAVGDGRVRFVVRDTGVGFDPAEKARLFRPFEQVDATITRRFGGSGLGLAIADQLATRMGGRLDCSAREGEGACFWLDLPLELAPNDSFASEGESSPGRSDASALRVLVADDNAANRKIVELILASVGAESVSVEDGAEAVAAFEIMAFDLVLMDIQMPVMDGLSAVRLLRLHEQKRGGRPTPILMVSANAMPEHVAASVAAGANGHLSKPLTAGRLLSRMQDIVGFSQGPGEAEDDGPSDRRTAGQIGKI